MHLTKVIGNSISKAFLKSQVFQGYVHVAKFNFQKAEGPNQKHLLWEKYGTLFIETTHCQMVRLCPNSLSVINL